MSPPSPFSFSHHGSPINNFFGSLGVAQEARVLIIIMWHLPVSCSLFLSFLGLSSFGGISLEAKGYFLIMPLLEWWVSLSSMVLLQANGLAMLRLLRWRRAPPNLPECLSPPLSLKIVGVNHSLSSLPTICPLSRTDRSLHKLQSRPRETQSCTWFFKFFSPSVFRLRTSYHPLRSCTPP